MVIQVIISFTANPGEWYKRQSCKGKDLMSLQSDPVGLYTAPEVPVCG